jgi:hypothetical protein
MTRLINKILETSLWPYKWHLGFEIYKSITIGYIVIEQC